MEISPAPVSLALAPVLSEYSDTGGEGEDNLGIQEKFSMVLSHETGARFIAVLLLRS